ncbi:biotin-dependent carboxyltransferase [Alicyclobacillus cycloheptanicus]|uniref:Antagonist of KipI n=1 Tax=Alicyclobacillus cycloheptanicus TaxID=1457 RepID=A0ABT9XD74_9BACL|nr:biotin-dependent carboxyltransferase family protein [Alicyclobacillus cycloheptanicus]MDQ0188246.1 antagonist of KipI [Alicyclobacillus cycloheptanicus]WDM00971.1 biotin-dependent carboxyltransferase [Alicyclobacillus cycloheptanicus]
MYMEVLDGGFLTTVQDLGRMGWQRYGVAVSGVMDAQTATVANLLVGNDRNAAVLEATLRGPRLRFHDETLVAVCGVGIDATVDGMAVEGWRPCLVAAGRTLEVRSSARGCRVYIAVGGGVLADRVLGSQSTYLYGRFGGFHGRAVQKGDVLQLGAPTGETQERMRRLRRQEAFFAVEPRWAAGHSVRPRFAPEGSVRFLPGPDLSRLSPDAQETLFAATYRVSPSSNRMGLRLEGPVLQVRDVTEPVSKPVTRGTVQLLNDGQLVVLMADHQTTGGYPNLGQVFLVDLPQLAQAKPGDRLRFTAGSLAEAHRALRERTEGLRVLEVALRLMDAYGWRESRASV